MGTVQQWVKTVNMRNQVKLMNQGKLPCESSNNIDNSDPDCLLTNTVALGSVRKPKVAVRRTVSSGAYQCI